ncbi:MAG: Flp pilus assembly protein CpaB [Actinomycetota bacterium]
MRNWRVLTAIAAVVLAALAGFLVWQYVDEADERAEEDLDQVRVLVAAEPIQRGVPTDTLLDEGFIVAENRVERDVPRSALVPEQAEDIRGLVAAGAIAPGEIIVALNFIAAGEVEGTALDIEEGREAITVNVDNARGVGGFIAPNDTVNVVVSLDIQNSFANTPEARAVVGKTTAFLLPGIRVLAVGTTTTFGTQSRTDTDADGDVDQDDIDTSVPQETGVITLSVTPRQAEQIVHAQAINQGSIYLTLNPKDFDLTTFQTPEEIVEVVNLFDQPLTKVDEVLTQLGNAAAQGNG